MEMNVVRDVEDDMQGLHIYIGDKRRTRENMGPLLNKMRALVTQDMEKAEVLDVTFATAFNSSTGLQRSQLSETRGKVWSKEDGV